MNQWRRARGPRGWVTAVGVAALVLGLTAAGNAPARGATASRGREGGQVVSRGKPARRVSGTAPTALR